MAETPPTVIDAWSPEMVAALGWRGEILTDESATTKHRLLAANALVAVLAEQSPSEDAIYATLPTAIAATTGRLPRIDQAFTRPTRDIFSPYHDPEKQLERWNAALSTAYNLSHAVGEPFYDTGAYRDVGLVLPIIGAQTQSVHTEIRWHRSIIDHTLDRVTASLVFMGMKRRYSTEQNVFAIVGQRYKRQLASRPGTAFDGSTTTGSLSYDFGGLAVHVALDDAAELQTREINARQFSLEVGDVPASATCMNDDRIDFGTTDERDTHIEMLKTIYRQYFAAGVVLGKYFELH